MKTKTSVLLTILLFAAPLLAQHEFTFNTTNARFSVLARHGGSAGQVETFTAEIPAPYSRAGVCAVFNSLSISLNSAQPAEGQFEVLLSDGKTETPIFRAVLHNTFAGAVNELAAPFTVILTPEDRLIAVRFTHNYNHSGELLAAAGRFEVCNPQPGT
jgi:hypothetical protein